MNGTEQDVEVGDSTPPIREQARLRGWDCDFFDFGKAKTRNVEFFNPGLVRRPDGLWLLVRRSEITPGMWYGKNGIWACKLEGKKPLGGPTLKFPNTKGEEQMEDPRAVFWNNQTWVSVVNFTWFTTGSWTGAHIALGIFQDKGGSDITEETWTPLARRDPVVGTNLGHAGPTNGKHNKNVLFWFIEGKLHCLYTSDPWAVVQFGSKWEEQIPYVAEGVQWEYGVVRGGTPPVRAGDFYYTFFHSSLPWRGRYRRYFMGAIAFEVSPPFRPVFWTQEPILTGSQNDIWAQRKPLVVFPCGSVLENDKWLVTLGVNDIASAWLEIPHSDLLQLLKPIPVVPGLSLLSDVTPTPEYEPIPFEPDLSGGGKISEQDAQARQTEPLPAPEAENNAPPTQVPFRPRCDQPYPKEGKTCPKCGMPPISHEWNPPTKKGRGRPRKDGLPPGSVPPKLRRKYRKRRKRKALKSKA